MVSIHLEFSTKESLTKVELKFEYLVSVMMSFISSVFGIHDISNMVRDTVSIKILFEFCISSFLHGFKLAWCP